MHKVETIRRHKSGNPNVEEKRITWIEFVAEVEPESEGKMNNFAIALLNGEFLFINGYTYFLTGLNVRDSATQK